MFGNARNAISAYQKVGIDAAIEVALAELGLLDWVHAMPAMGPAQFQPKGPSRPVHGGGGGGPSHASPGVLG